MVGLKALLFDFDGTLAETEEAHREAFNRAFSEAGLPFFWDQPTYKELLWVTGGKERIRHFLKTCPSCPRLSDEEIARIHRRKNELFAQAVQKGLPLRPGVLRLLREAEEAGLTLGLATTTSLENVEAFLEGLGHSLRFELILAGGIVPRKKPDPAIYRLALERLGLSPEEVLAVEDSRNGLLSARGVGIPTLITPSLYTLDQEFSEAQAVLEHLGEPEAPALVYQGPGRGERRVVDLAYLEEVRRWSSI